MRGIRRFFAAAAAAGTLLIGSGTALAPAFAAPPTTDPATAADFAAHWLVKELTPEGFVPSQTDASQPDYGNTAYAVLALASAGLAHDQAASALDYLAAHLDEAVQSGGADAPGALATLILAVDAFGSDPRNFGGSDLVARLLATQRTAGADAGLFGTQDPQFDGAYRQGLALMALAAAGVDNDLGEQWLAEQQCAGGGWTAYRADPAVPCTPTDPATFTGPDSNSTAVALSGLSAAGVAAPAAGAVGFLESTQGTDGGWAYMPAPDQASDPNSTALVIQALLAAGADPVADTRFDESGGDPMTRLLSFQLGCDAGEDAGAFFFPSPGTEPTANVLATVQAAPAAALESFPLDVPPMSTDQPPAPCPTSGPGTQPTSPGAPAAPGAPAVAEGDEVARDTLPATGPEPSSTGDLLGAAFVLIVAGLLVRSVVKPAAKR